MAGLLLLRSPAAKQPQLLFFFSINNTTASLCPLSLLDLAFLIFVPSGA
jgi:hypothetical protein